MYKYEFMCYVSECDADLVVTVIAASSEEARSAANAALETVLEGFHVLRLVDICECIV